MRFELIIDSDGDAFHVDPVAELGLALDKVKHNLRMGATYGKVLDSNGNSAGRWSLDVEPDEVDELCEHGRAICADPSCP